MKTIFRSIAMFVLTLGLVGPVLADSSLGTAVAQRYGIDHWDQIASIEFTFNVKTAKRDTARHWKWDVREGRVTRTVNDTSSTIDLTGEVTRKQVHRQFINDSYWLLFPFQLVWSDPAVTDKGTKRLPIGEGEATKLVCQWPTEGGYTPGDAYDLYLGEDGLIRQWAFRRGGKHNGNAHTWEDHQQLGPIIVSLDHHGRESSGFHLWFTEVKATLADGTVVTPQPIAEP